MFDGIGISIIEAHREDFWIAFQGTGMSKDVFDTIFDGLIDKLIEKEYRNDETNT